MTQLRDVAPPYTYTLTAHTRVNHTLSTTSGSLLSKTGSRGSNARGKPKPQVLAREGEELKTTAILEQHLATLFPQKGGRDSRGFRNIHQRSPHSILIYVMGGNISKRWSTRPSLRGFVIFSLSTSSFEGNRLCQITWGQPILGILSISVFYNITDLPHPSIF